MATQKRSARGKPQASDESWQPQAERLSRRLGESAQQVWLAGIGALGRAQAEGSKLFDTLVREGLSLEQATRKTTQGRVEAMREAVESSVAHARESATETWDRLEKVFEDRVQRALRRLDIPSREDLDALSRRIDALDPAAGTPGAGAAPAAKRAPRRKPAVSPAAKVARASVAARRNVAKKPAD
ncbi:phasin family protein [Pseudoxanthomonas mexicana]|uniref:phasin family protein n=1 Tax=Pseudoxanthomonas mexicana TaxID=128785 RepID=UPI00398AFEA6